MKTNSVQEKKQENKNRIDSNRNGPNSVSRGQCNNNANTEPMQN